MEEQSQQLKEVISDVVVRLLQAQDTRQEERLVFIQGHFIDAVPGKESKLENVLYHHHDLEKSRAANRRCCWSNFVCVLVVGAPVKLPAGFGAFRTGGSVVLGSDRVHTSV